tara:strand:- start:270 stop:863 length:594 start_codon:yes stop_codon:yes gene_type:complete
MITFIDLSPSEPYQLFKYLYDKAEASEKIVEAICISSFDERLSEVQSRFVNLKYVKNDEWIFFSNYNSPKAFQFKHHNQIAATFFWPSINSQIRIKAKVFKTSKKFSDEHYLSRDKDKNKLAHLSEQSEQIISYEEMINKFDSVENPADFNLRPKYWGGYSFKPYYFEFWEGHKSRINRRKVFKFEKGIWSSYFLQP